MEVLAVPAFQDNYLWLLHDDERRAWVVDPGDPAPIEAALEGHGLTLSGVLITHHHFDHTRGALQLAERYDCAIFGPTDSPFAGITDPLRDGAVLTLGSMPVSCPTSVHVTVYII